MTLQSALMAKADSDIAEGAAHCKKPHSLEVQCVLFPLTPIQINGLRKLFADTVSASGCANVPLN